MLDGFVLTDAQQQFITALVGGLFGFAGSMLREYYKRKKSPQDHQKEATQTIVDGADRIVKTSGNLIELLEERLADERIHFQKKMTQEREYLENELHKCKKECEDRIIEMQLKFTELEKKYGENNGIG